MLLRYSGCLVQENIGHYGFFSHGDGGRASKVMAKIQHMSRKPRSAWACHAHKRFPFTRSQTGEQFLPIYTALQIVSPPPHPRLDTMSGIKLAPHVEDFLGGVRLLSVGYVVSGDESVLAPPQATFPDVPGVPMPSTKRQRVQATDDRRRRRRRQAHGACVYFRLEI